MIESANHFHLKGSLMEQEIKKIDSKPKKSATKIGAVIILVISALVFLPFGASAVFQSIFNKRTVNSFGSYDGKKIVYEPGSKFHNAVTNMAQMYESRGIKLEDNSYRIMYDAFNQTMIDMAFTEAVKKSGYVVPESAVDRQLVYRFTDPATGQFSQKAYNQTSQAEITQLRSNIEASLTYSRFFNDLFGTDGDNTFNGKALYGLKTSDAEKQFIASMGEDTKAFEAVAFKLADFPQDAVAAYAKDNADKFVKFDLSVITLDSEDEAKGVLKQIEGNEITFDDAASERSQKYYSSDEGKIAGSYRYQLENMVEDKDQVSQIEALQKDELSAVIKTEKGYSIFRCDGDKEEADFADDAVLEAVSSYVKSTEKSYVENYFLQQADNFVSQVAVSSFDEACENFQLEKESVAAFPVNFENSRLLPKAPQSGILSSLASDASAYQKAFSLKEGEVGSPFVLGNNVVVLHRVSPESIAEEEDSTADAEEEATADDSAEELASADEAEELAQEDELVQDTDAEMEANIRSASLASANMAIFASDKVEDSFFATYIGLLNSSRN